MATPPLKFRTVTKEMGTQGSIFLLWCIGNDGMVCASQSLPALIRWLNERQDSIHFRISSLYRVSRGGQVQHHGWKVARYSISDIDAVNSQLAEFRNLVFLTRFPDNWQFAQTTSGISERCPVPGCCSSQTPIAELPAPTQCQPPTPPAQQSCVPG